MNLDIAGVLGTTDIYLVDQIMKGRFKAGDVLLEAGCGMGRNLHWFLRNNFEIYGIDKDPTVIQELIRQNPELPPGRFRINAVEQTSFDAEFFDNIISSAVLHFAKNYGHFFQMIGELYRVLKPEGTLFIRMASDIGIEGKVQPLGNGVFGIPDGSTRFLLTRDLMEQVLIRYPLTFLEDFKTVNVADLRCMSTLMLQKKRK